MRRDHFEPIPSYVTNRRTLRAWRNFDDRRLEFLRFRNLDRRIRWLTRSIVNRYRKASAEYFKRTADPRGVLRPPAALEGRP